ncbi:TPA: hypothetical protein NJ328_003818 [Vibrio parahaemolyticus]|uniref:hypothetical protein n=1 Tax=Vibrio parahaemolyticus TaxID=670 RepID=UPI0018699D57|nr:hypothetical protein [Vibrio parahaemolyticus]MBE4371797.1 hypothetical protein [Vibrio parahaemolyticus]HCG7114924.1 hypothetical protein [Vibrio parahaemolyticus]HCG9115559.1 hypothetical protein [Vibrio parahaemolyticus]HCH5915047.1 hypothetical protein [Vibrio parahaemolyticus]
MTQQHKTFKLSSCISESCPEPDCSFFCDSDEFAKSIDHLVNEHKYKLVHVGQETTRDDVGENWQMTVAILANS